MANLLFWLGEDRILFGSDYAIWSPKWIIDKFMSFQFPDDVREEFGMDLTPAIRRKIMGENAARLYGIDIEAHRARLAADEIGARLATAA
jgi:predicted TIM-barrel fold metal-dependent hydrolase